MLVCSTYSLTFSRNKNVVKYLVVIVFPEPDIPVTTMHCGFLLILEALTAFNPEMREELLFYLQGIVKYKYIN